MTTPGTQLATRSTNEPSVARFWSKILIKGTNECWPWMAYRTKFGYGRVGWRGRLELAHRVAYSISHDSWPGEVCVLHSCDNPSCCNPAHLSLGTVADNNRDKDSKGRGRSVKGEQHGQAKFTDADVLSVRRARLSGIGLRKISKQLGLPMGFVGRVLYLGKWAHIQLTNS